MDIYEELYGKFAIEEPVLLDLLASPALQRLKNIYMAGPAYYLNPQWNETRYEHSLGVMLLIRRMGGCIEEQIAGLLHDISHTAFSHGIDYLLDISQQNYHENIKESFLKTTEIPMILNKWSYDYRELLLHDEEWPILEQETPLLCADRIDYTLREVYRYFDTPLAEIHKFLDDLSFYNGKLVLNSASQGIWFMQQYKKIVVDFFYHPVNAYSYTGFKHLVQVAFQEKILTLEDFQKTEDFVWHKINQSDNLKINHAKETFFTVENAKIAEKQEKGVHYVIKERYVDPLIITEDGGVAFTSTILLAGKMILDETKKETAAGIYLERLK